MKPPHILVIEDEQTSRSICQTALHRAEYQVTVALTAREGLQQLRSTRFDLALLDLNLPDADGLSLASTLRGTHPALPIIMMTVRTAAEQRAAGLEAGAVDYLSKPFQPVELLHRVRRALAEGPPAPVTQINFGAWQLDVEQRTLRYGEGFELELTLGEARLIEFLLRARGRPVNRDQLAEAVARSGEGNPKSVDMLVSRLRRKLEDTPRNPRHIVTVPSLGYRIDADE